MESLAFSYSKSIDEIYASRNSTVRYSHIKVTCLVT